MNIEVIQLIPSYLIKSSGTSKAFKTLINGLREKYKEIKITTFSLKWLGNEKNELKKNNFFFDVNLLLPKKLGFSYSLYKELSKKIKESGKNKLIIHIHGMWMITHLIPFFLPNRKNLYIVLQPHGSITKWSINNKKFIKIPLLILLKMRLKKYSTFLVSTSDYESKMIKLIISNSKVIKLPNIIKYKEDLEGNYLSEKKHQKLPLDIFYIGRIDPKKNIETLIKSYLNSKYKNLNSNLLIAGPIDNNYSKDILKKYQSHKKIKFIGEIHGKEKFKRIKNSRFIIMPSFCENYGYVILESLSMSTPVIASINSYWTHVEDNSAGFVCKTNFEELRKILNLTAELSDESILNIRRNAYKLYRNEINKNKNSLNLYKDFYELITND